MKDKHHIVTSSALYRIGYRFEGNKVLQSALSTLKYLPFPYQLSPVTVGDHILYVQRFDRFLALLLRKAALLSSLEVYFLQRLCSTGMTFIEIGANIGFHTVELAKLVGSKGRLIVYEPDRSNFETLRKKFYC